MNYLIFGLLTASGRITRLELSRWTKKGGCYRNIKRFYHDKQSWMAIHWLFSLRKHLLKKEDEDIMGGDETVISRAGRETYGLDRFSSGVQQKVISNISFFSSSLS